MQIRRSALRYLSHAFSAPIFAMPVFVVLGLLERAPTLDLLLCVLFATLLPIIGIVWSARSSGLDYDISERTARVTPFLIAIASYLAGFLLLIFRRTPVLLSGLMLAYCVNTLAMFLITLSWKISVHTAGITGPLSFLVFKLGPWWGLLYLSVIPVGLTRLRLRQHSLLQLSTGAVLSAALTWIQIIFLVPLIPS